MHQCFTVEDWIRAWTVVDSEEQRRSTDCRCVGAGGDLLQRLDALLECGACSRFLIETPGVPDEVVNCSRCMAACDELEAILAEAEHFDPAVAAESFSTEGLYSRLLELPAEEWRERIARDPHLQRWCLCQRLLREAQAHWRNDPARAHAHASAAVAVAERLDDGTYHPRWVADLQAKAHAYLGNSLRVLARFPEAERELTAAHSHARRGVESGRVEARILSLRASLLNDLGRRDEAEELLGRVEAYYASVGDRTELARTQLKRADALALRDEFRLAAEECARAYGNLDPREQSRLSILACQNAVEFLAQSGQVERARNLFDSLAHTDERVVLLRRKWIEGNLLRAEGRLSQAVATYEEARRDFAAAELPYTVALISLDQALTAYEMGELDMMRDLAREAGVLLSEAGARRETMAVLRVLRAAIEQGTVTRSVLSAIRKRVADTRPSG